MDAIKYKGYIGSIEIDFDDDCIYASVSNAPGLNLIAEGVSPSQVKAAFESIIDDYLESAESEGWGIISPVEQELSAESEKQHEPSNVYVIMVSKDKVSKGTRKLLESGHKASKKSMAYSRS